VRAPSNPLRETVVPLALLGGDTFATFAALTLSYWLRYDSPLARYGIAVPDATFGRYLPLLCIGVALLVATFAQLGLYDSRLVLRRYQSLNTILKGTAFWLFAYLGVWLLAKLDPPISRLFAVIAFGCVVALLYVWRTIAYALVARSPVLARLRRRAVLLGWNDDARVLATDIARDPAHPFTLAGVITLPGTATPFSPADLCRPMGDKPPEAPRHLGAAAELDSILARESVDLVILTRLDLPRDQLNRIMEACERAYVEWKAVPGSFDIFLTGLRLQTIGRVPVLGVEELAINRLFNRALKRAVDLVGAAVGLLASVPAVLVLAALIKRESPDGPVFFRQKRVGDGHREFSLWKLRSMRPDAAATDFAHQSTQRDDPRLLRIGAWMRRWNLDELPQFWNVLVGDMSLVGPRPERPHHVDRLAGEIPHYLPRHLVKPGMTGWAQVNGLRGDSDLHARVQHDIYYIENWSVWLDLQIMALTFVRWRDSAY
jgi:exopolysaccharide biosynthesis polyprenyl glycosylphosphotransferase